MSYDYFQRLVWETEGRRGAAERGWLGEDERLREIERQREEYEEYEEYIRSQEEYTRSQEECEDMSTIDKLEGLYHPNIFIRIVHNDYVKMNEVFVVKNASNIPDRRTTILECINIFTGDKLEISSDFADPVCLEEAKIMLETKIEIHKKELEHMNKILLQFEVIEDE